MWIEIFIEIGHYITMNVKQALLLLCVSILLVCACESSVEEDVYSNPNQNVVPEGIPRQYWAFNNATSRYEQVTADLAYDGVRCRIWVERGADVSAATAKSVANTFDGTIYPKLMNTFGIYGNITSYGEIIAHNTMELADWLGDGDGKLTILLLDIKDNYNPGVNESRVTGYFSAYDLMEGWEYSNRADILYIDTNPERPGSTESYKTIAHEMQHLMNFVTSVLARFRDNTVYQMDTWINEGLSVIAEWVYSGQYSESRWTYYNADPSGLLRYGNNFYIWGNRTNEHHYAELDDYSTVYLFFHWLRLQTGGTRIFTNLISSKEYNYLAVTEAADNAIGGAGYDDWGTLLKTWLSANYINASSGPHGYMNDRTLRNIKAHTVPQGIQNIMLYPGEGVYSLTRTGFPWPDAGENIRYAGLVSRTPWVNDTETYSGGALLTYNVNPDNGGPPEEGITSGIAANIDTTLYQQRIRALLSERVVIDIGSMYGQNWQGEKPEQAVAGFAEGFVNLE